MCHCPSKVESMCHRVSRFVGFPDVNNPVSGKNRLPCILQFLHHWASCCVRLRIYAHDGFQWKLASMCTSILAVGLPRCWASQLHTLWPPAWTGFHAFHSIFVTGPPAFSGFPFNPQSRLRRRPASMCTSILVERLPHGRASQLYTTWLPAWTGFHISCIAFITRPPASSSFPSTRSKASGIGGLPVNVHPCNGPPA